MAVLPRPQTGVGVIILNEGKILMGKRLGKLGYGTYGWIGGHIENGETLEQCARREVMEETGLELKTLTFLCVNSVFVDGLHYIDIEFLAVPTTYLPQVLEPTKIESWNWYPMQMDKLPQPLFPPCQTTVQCYFQQLPTIQ